MPSFCMRDCSVVRFNPNLAAAPTGPPTTHFTSRKQGAVLIDCGIPIGLKVQLQ